MKIKNKWPQKALGSSFDDFLKEKGDYKTTQAVAIKRVHAWQIQATKEKHLKRLRLPKNNSQTRLTPI